jgi:predicted Zn-dependent protease
MIAVQLLALKYGRDDESESDTFGMRFAARAGYHPEGVIGVMRMLDSHSREHGGGPPEFLSTHPDPGNRVKSLSDQLAKEYPQASAGSYVRNEAQLGTALLDCRAAQAAYDIADKGDTAMAAGFKAAEGGNPAGAKAEYSKALELYRQAAGMRRDHAILHVNVAQAAFYLEQFDASEQSIKEALRLEPGTFWPNFMGGLVAIKRNDNAAAESRLGAALRLVPGSPTGLFYLALASDRGGKQPQAVENYRKSWDAFRGQGDLAERARKRLIELGQPDPKTR